MTGLDPITVADAGPVLAEAMGLRWDSDRPEVVKYLNKYRELLYTMYDDFKLFDNVFHCICISEFKQLCGTACANDCYHGFTLPNDILSVEAVFSYGASLTLRSRWRESHTGLGLKGSRIAALEMAETFCTERDLIDSSKIRIFTEREEDDGKLVYVEVVTKDHKRRKICFKLVSDGWALSPVSVRQILSVALPAGRVGCLTLAEASGRELSSYAPWETVPNYRRMKVNPVCGASTVLVQGVKKFQKIYFDHDIVEVGNGLIIEAAARFFKYGEATTETREIQRAQFDKSEMAALMRGLISRHKGHAIQDNTPFRGNRTIAKKPLIGYQKR